jgi:4-hydroxybenzoyl-CoA reductase subunit beta
MLRLPPFRYLVPRTLDEALFLKTQFGARAAYVSGGTDLLPKMKRRQQEPQLLIQVGKLPELGRIEEDGDGGHRIGAATTLTAVAASPVVRERWAPVARAVAQVATPAVRNMATLGGNLCLDTRCTFYDQSMEWRHAIDFCMKKDGDTCQVAGSSKRCWAVQSGDTAPILIALGAQIELAGPAGLRLIDAASFYNDDGVRYLNKDAKELVTGVRLRARDDVDANVVKVSRRLSFDFALLSVAVCLARESSRAPVRDARVVLGALGSAPLVVREAAEALTGRPLDRDSIEAAAEAASRRARPLDNADLAGAWRKRVVRPYVVRALTELLEPNGGRSS